MTNGAAPDADLDTVGYLGNSVAISVLPSVAALRDLRAVAGRSKAPQPFIGFADPAFAGADTDRRSVADAANLCRQGEPIDPAVLRGLPRLRESADEIKRIATALGAGSDAVVTGAAATERRVRESDLARYRVVAFATHGLLPGELRCQAEPALALTPPATPTKGEDGLLDASEVATLKLDADWVVLSACNTAGPDGTLGGESLSGLARAFFYAGARALLVSHWAVASGPTVDLTTGHVRGAGARQQHRQGGSAAACADHAPVPTPDGASVLLGAVRRGRRWRRVRSETGRPMADLTGGELVARVLKQAGVGHVFTLCGGHILPIYDGCVKDGIGVIDVRHEQAAAHAADAYARLTRNVGVAIVTAGPGVTDAVTGVANAYAARSPLLLIGGAAPLGLRGLGALQEMEQVALLRPITKGVVVGGGDAADSRGADDRHPRRAVGTAGPGVRRDPGRSAAHQHRGSARAHPDRLRAPHPGRRRSAGHRADGGAAGRRQPARGDGGQRRVLGRRGGCSWRRSPRPPACRCS